MAELRYEAPPTHVRVLYVYEDTGKAVLLLGGDKAGNWDTWCRQNIARAEALYDLHLRMHPQPDEGGTR